MALDGAAFARWWADRYTRGLPADVRDRRRAEIASDVFEHLHATSAGTADASRGIGVAWRATRGIPADLAWRRLEKRAMHGATPDPNGSPLRNAWAVVTQNWFAPIAVLIGVFDVLASIAVLTEADGKMPGKVIGPIVMTMLALSIFGGLRLRWRAGRARALGPGRAATPTHAVSGRQLALLAAILVGSLALLVVGASAGAISIFFIGVVVLGGSAFVLGGRLLVRAIRSSDEADKAALAAGMIIVGTLPALALFWMVIPPLLAIAVIAGVLGTSPRVRTAA
ncbi:MAG: hypothetical protein WDA60_07410 [Acidimicrobiia bacterium]|jgi:hypothetical protein